MSRRHERFEKRTPGQRRGSAEGTTSRLERSASPQRSVHEGQHALKLGRGQTKSEQREARGAGRRSACRRNLTHERRRAQDGSGSAGGPSARATSELVHEGRHPWRRFIGRLCLRFRRGMPRGRSFRRLLAGPKIRGTLDIRGTTRQTTRRRLCGLTATEGSQISSAPRHSERSHSSSASSTSSTQHTVCAGPQIVRNRFPLHPVHPQKQCRGPPRDAEDDHL